MPWDPVDPQNHTIDMAVHAALVPGGAHGKVLYFGGYLVDDTHLFDVETHAIEAAPSLPGYNIFCAGHAFLADGRLLIAGGQLELGGAPPPHAPPPDDVIVPHLHGNMSWGGERRCSIYHPLTEQWVDTGPLSLDPQGAADSGGRWYPTLCTLADGNVLAVGGHPDLRETYPGTTADTVRHSNNTPELYRTGAGTWKLYASHPPAENQTTAGHEAYYDYQRTHLLPDGTVFFASPVRGANRVFDPDTGTFLASPEIDRPTHDPASWVGLYQAINAAFTSVMLPLLHQEGYRPRVLLMGDRAPKRIDLGDLDAAAWTTAGTRDWSGDPPRRLWVSPVILPTGEVFFTGGTAADEQGESAQDLGVLEGELYDPGVDWGQGAYVSETGSWDTVEAAAVVRHYHGTALLMTDGSVWTAGSNGPSPANLDPSENRELRWERYRPWYFGAARPVITDAPQNAGYGTQIEIGVEDADGNGNADAINRVVLLRCGSVTHGYNPDQRYLTLPFDVTGDATLVATIPYMPAVFPPGRYLLWVVDDDGVPCAWGRFLRVSRQKPLITTDISTYSEQEVAALGTPAAFTNALYVVYDGFLPDEVEPPDYEVVWSGAGGAVPGVTATFGPPKYEAGAGAKDTAQRIVFPCHLTFESAAAFAAIPDDEDFRTFVFRATMRGTVAQATLTLSTNLNPRMRNGDPHWLSVDLRTFSTRPGLTPTAGVEHGAGLDAPHDYIHAVLEAYNGWGGGDHPFDALPTGQASNKLPLYSHDGAGHPVFNYAVARVRLRAPEEMTAADVRVFFRLWTTGWTALAYGTNPATSAYPRSGDGAGAAPLLGLYGGEINTIPCFAEPREANMASQQDPANLRPITGQGAQEVHAYYGCWLDFNQDVKRFPLSPDPGATGPFSGDLRSIQELMRGLHQCLVAEVHYWPDDPIPPGATPASHDSLAQRNLLLDDSDNPGGFAAHLVHHTFEMKPSDQPFPPELLLPAASATAGRVHPDELVIEWGGLPRESLVTLYLPQLDADEVIRFAERRQGPRLLARADAHTVQCRVTDVGFFPIPGPLTNTIAGLLSVQLPPTVTAGERFSIVLRQVEARRRRVIGTTQFDIRVGTADAIRPGKERDLAVLKHVALAIPPANRWYPVFERYLSELGDRIRAFGGDPDAIEPSPTGGGRPERPAPGEPGRFEGKVEVLLYDCFGDFEGFVLRTCEGRRRFRACERGVERVVHRACRTRDRVAVVTDASGAVVRLLVRCCGSGRPEEEERERRPRG